MRPPPRAPPPPRPRPCSCRRHVPSLCAARAGCSRRGPRLLMRDVSWWGRRGRGSRTRDSACPPTPRTLRAPHRSVPAACALSVGTGAIGNGRRLPPRYALLSRDARRGRSLVEFINAPTANHNILTASINIPTASKKALAVSKDLAASARHSSARTARAAPPPASSAPLSPEPMAPASSALTASSEERTAMSRW